jgi:hypothetical protein
MKCLASATTALVIILILAARASAADQTPREIVERAIKAHGGQQRLEKLKADRVTLKGTLFINDTKGVFTSEMTVNLPSQFRHTIELIFPTNKRSIVELMDGDKVTVVIDGKPQPKPEASAVAEMRGRLRMDRIVRLTALLSDKAFTLEALGESKIHDKAVVGVKVKVKNERDVKLFFDKETGLLVKSDRILEESGKEVVQEEHYSEFKDIGGYTQPTKFVVFRGGKRLMEAELVDVKYLDKVDETLFTKP